MPVAFNNVRSVKIAKGTSVLYCLAEDITLLINCNVESFGIMVPLHMSWTEISHPCFVQRIFVPNRYLLK